MDEYEYQPLSIADAELALQARGLKYRRHGEHDLYAQCPAHNGGDFNCQITEQDGKLACYCYSHCGFFWMDDACEELKEKRKGKPVNYDKIELKMRKEPYESKTITKKVKQIPELQELWRSGRELPPERIFPEIPNSELWNLGWRWIDHDPYFGMGRGVLIPYWTSDYQGGEGTLGFAQVRHLEGNPRFNFARGLEPRVYGKWILPMVASSPVNERVIWIVEGTHDWVVLNTCSVPAIGMPSSSSGQLAKALIEFCKRESIQPVYAGDNDAAGNKLRAVFDNSGIPYRTCQPPGRYKDWGEYAEQTNLAEVSNYVNNFCARRSVDKRASQPNQTEAQQELAVQKVLDMFPGAELLTTTT